MSEEEAKVWKARAERLYQEIIMVIHHCDFEPLIKLTVTRQVANAAAVWYEKETGRPRLELFGGKNV